MNNRIYDKEKLIKLLNRKLYCESCYKIVPVAVSLTKRECCENSKLVGINEMRNIKIDRILNGT
jgi:hypothetical protein